MSLNTEDKKYIVDTIQKNNRDLIIQFAQIFPTKVEVQEMIDLSLNRELNPIKERLSRVEDMSATILHRLDIEQLPFVEKQLDNHEVRITKLEKH